MVFRRSTTTLGAVLEGLEVPFHARPAPVEVDIKSAILNLSVLALRTARAAGVLIRTGYELEAHGLLRRVAEAHARVGAVLDDESGQHAREWLTGPSPSTPRRVVGKHGNLEFFDLYSDSAHATMTGLRRFVAIALPDGRSVIPFQPMRDSTLANTMLVELAVECRDFAMITGHAFARKVRGLQQLDEELLAAIDSCVAQDATDVSDAEGPGST